MIPATQYRRAAYLVDTHGAAERFTVFMYPNPQGRPAVLSARTFLIGCLLAIEVHRSMLYTHVFQVLARELPPEAMVELGVAERAVNAAGQPVARVTLKRHHVYNFTRRLRRLSGGGRHGHPIRTEDKAALLEVVNLTLKATLPTRPAGSGAYAVDESGVWAWSRGRSGRKKATAQTDETDLYEDDSPADPEHDSPADPEHDAPASSEPASRSAIGSIDRDAAWGGKTSKAGKDERYFGYSLHGLVRAPALGAEPGSEPLLLERLDLTPAATDLVDATLAMLDEIVDDGGTVTELIGDRHYSFKHPARWISQLIARGIKQVADLRFGDHGFTDAAGTRVAAGHPHCPGTPDHLATIIKPGPQPKTPVTLRNDHTDEQAAQRYDNFEEFRRLIAERQSYALQRHGRSKSNENDWRWRCQALAGIAGCPLRPETLEAAMRLGLPIVQNPPDPVNAPSVCTSKSGTVTLKFEDLNPKFHQEHYWGSPEWQESYARRTYVEGFFGTLKDAAVANLKRDAYRGDCLGLKLLHVGLCCAVTNLRLARSWNTQTGSRLDLPDVLLAEDEYPQEVPLHDAA
jgi:hypothetical protein